MPQIIEYETSFDSIQRLLCCRSRHFKTGCAVGQIKLRRIDGWRKISAVLSHHTAAA